MNPLDELTKLTSLFPDADALFSDVEHVPQSATPEPYHRMLVHDHHMTVTMEEYHQCKVEVKLLDLHHKDHIYCRKIVLVKAGTDDVVQFGIVRFDFQYVTKAVEQEIIAGETPLGRVLINHNVLRNIDLGAILRIKAGRDLAEVLHMEINGETYGRLATIFCNRKPAVDLLEISIPLT